MAKTLNVIGASISSLKRALREKTPLTGIETLVHHPGIHNDEIAAITIFREYGEEQFPDCKAIPTGTITKQVVIGTALEDRFWILLSKGHFSIGCNGGPFDEHSGSEECAATLMAKYLGVDKLPELQQLLNYTRFSDRNGDTFFAALDKREKVARDAAQAFLPSAIVKSANEIIDYEDYEEQEEMIDVVVKYLSYNVRKQRQYHTNKKRILGEKPFEVIDVLDKKILFIKDACAQAGKIVRAHVGTLGIKPLLTVIINPEKSHFCIQNNQSNKYNITGVVINLRRHFFAKKGMEIPDARVLMQKEDLHSAPFLYYHKDAEAFYNGSLTQPDSTGYFGTIFSQEDILNAIIKSLQYDNRKVQRSIGSTIDEQTKGSLLKIQNE